MASIAARFLVTCLRQFFFLNRSREVPLGVCFPFFDFEFLISFLMFLVFFMFFSDIFIFCVAEKKQEKMKTEKMKRKETPSGSWHWGKSIVTATTVGRDTTKVFEFVQ